LGGDERHRFLVMEWCEGAGAAQTVVPGGSGALKNHRKTAIAEDQLNGIQRTSTRDTASNVAARKAQSAPDNKKFTKACVHSNAAA